MRTWCVEDLRPQVQQHVAPLAREESYPRIIPIALRAWGIDDEVYLGGLAVVPDGDRTDALLECCVFNPFGPTRKQVLCTTLPDGRGRSLVRRSTTSSSRFARLVATAPADATDDDVRLVLFSLFARNSRLRQAVCSQLPTIVDLRDGGVCDVEFAARLFR